MYMFELYLKTKILRPDVTHLYISVVKCEINSIQLNSIQFNSIRLPDYLEHGRRDDGVIQGVDEHHRNLDVLQLTRAAYPPIELCESLTVSNGVCMTWDRKLNARP